MWSRHAYLKFNAKLENSVSSVYGISLGRAKLFQNIVENNFHALYLIKFDLAWQAGWWCGGGGGGRYREGTFVAILID